MALGDMTEKPWGKGPASETGSQWRAGGRGLKLLSDPITVSILRRIGNEKLELREITEDVCSTSRSTLFNRLGKLESMGALARETLSTMPRQSRYWLPAAGGGLLDVADALEGWLSRTHGRSTPLHTALASTATRALTTGWNTGILHELVVKPCSLAELDRRRPEIGYHNLRYALRILGVPGLVDQQFDQDRRLYRVTPFACQADGAIASAMGWEANHLPELRPPTAPRDHETLLLLARGLTRS
jgi:DNA-binding HxlR family transcriptional regulator